MIKDFVLVFGCTNSFQYQMYYTLIHNLRRSFILVLTLTRKVFAASFSRNTRFGWEIPQTIR